MGDKNKNKQQNINEGDFLPAGSGFAPIEFYPFVLMYVVIRNIITHLDMYVSIYIQDLPKTEIKNLSMVETDRFRKETSFMKAKVRVVREDEPNAFNDGSKNIFINKGLYDILTPKERIAIYLHEYGHHVNKDVQKDVYVHRSIADFLGGAIIANLIVLTGGLIGSNLLTMVIVAIPVAVMREVVLYIVSGGKKTEFLADSFAVQHGYGRHLIRALNKVEREARQIMCKGLTEEECDQVMESSHFLDEHPTTKKRVEALNKQLIESWAKMYKGNPSFKERGRRARRVSRILRSINNKYDQLKRKLLRSR